MAELRYEENVNQKRNTELCKAISLEGHPLVNPGRKIHGLCSLTGVLPVSLQRKVALTGDLFLTEEGSVELLAGIRPPPFRMADNPEYKHRPTSTNSERKRTRVRIAKIL